MAAGGYVRTAVSPLQETLRISLSLSDNQVALLQGPAVGIPVALAAIPLGLLIDRCSRARLLQWVVVLSVAGNLLTALAPNFAVLVLTRCLAGLMGLSTVPICYSLLADLYEPAQRGRATTAIAMGQLGGISAAFALGGVLLAMTGSVVDGWRWAMLWLTAPLLPVVLLLLALRDPSRMALTAPNPSVRQVWYELRQYRTVILPLVVGIVLIETAVGAILIWAAPTLSRNFGFTPDHVGSTMAMATLVSGILGPIMGGTLADVSQRVGGPRLTVALLSGLALLSAPAGLFALVPSIPLAVALLFIAMTIMLAVAVMGIILFTIVIPAELRGLCMSTLVAMCLLFAFAVGPVMVSVLSGEIGGLPMVGTALSAVCVTLSVIVAAAFAVGYHNIGNA